MERIIKKIQIPEELQDLPGIHKELAIKQLMDMLVDKLVQNATMPQKDWERIKNYVLTVMPEYDQDYNHNMKLDWSTNEIVILERSNR